MNETADPLPVIVVPDGLEAEGKNHAPTGRPSFVYRAVLDDAAAHYEKHTVYLAPANAFGGPVTEQEAALAYLNGKIPNCHLVPPAPNTPYIDTRGNARLLRAALEQRGAWPLGPCILLVAQLHARRAALCFRKEGFVLAAVHQVPYNLPVDAGIVRRLWYYRHPLLHRLYEILAYVRDACRPPFLLS